MHSEQGSRNRIASTARLRPAGTKFNRGYATLHQDEITLARDLHTACMLRYGRHKMRRILEQSPADAFRHMRYGRRFFGGSHQTLCLVIDDSQFLDNKAGNRHILTPVGDRRWRLFADRVRSLALLPRWADGWSATAEALDDLGYAIAESIAALMCWRIDGDESVVHFQRDAEQRAWMAMGECLTHAEA
jgi:hypothetical protein